MTEIVKIEERASLAIELGESHFREFKSCYEGRPGEKQPRDTKLVRRDIAEALVAFANADGGELLVGVEDDGTITGVDGLSDSRVDSLTGAPLDGVLSETPLESVFHKKILINGKTILYFSIEKSSSFIHQTSDGRCLVRSDLQTIPVSSENLKIERDEKLSREYDRAFVDGAAIKDLSAYLIGRVADEISPGMSQEKCLQYLGLAEYSPLGIRLRRAALLLFAIDPARWHPRIQVRIVKVDGTELKTGVEYNVLSDVTVTACVLELVDKAWEALRPLLVETKLGKDARFSATAMYPELACREALVNAIAHRDFSVEGRGVEIFVFDDRMQISNPGSLLSNIQIDDLLELKGVHQSRNALVARVLREIGFMRELGEGMRRIFELMKSSDLQEPTIESTKNTFSIVLTHETIYTEKQRIWLEQFEVFELSREQKVVVALGSDGRLFSTQDVIDALGIVDTDQFRALTEELRGFGIFEKAIPDSEAMSFSRKNRVPKRQVPRFRIMSPSSGQAQPGPSTRLEDVSAPNDEATLFVANIDYTVSNEELFEFFSEYGEVVGLRVPRRGEAGKGYAFVEFESEKQAINALFHMDGARLKSRKIVTKRYRARRSEEAP